MPAFDKKIYSAVNAEEAKKFIGREGYFSHFVTPNLKVWKKGVLKAVYPENFVNEIFSCYTEDNQFFNVYGLFVPKE